MSDTHTATAEPLKPLRTWSLLAGARKQPSEYEIVSVNTIFRANERDKVEQSPDAPMNRWARRYFNEGRIKHDDWNAFRDPDAITYRAYCTERDRNEVYVDGLLSEHSAHGHDAKLPAAWVDRLAAIYSPLRYLLHAAQMAAAYSVTMSPASTITNCLAFQMGDQFRWVSRVSYRTAELRQAHPNHGFGSGDRERWEKASELQGYRELMERLLVTYDWGDSLLAMNLVVMPAIDVSLEQLRDAAQTQGDALTRFLLEAHLKDSIRRNRWMKRFMEFISTKESNVVLATEVVERWFPRASEAVRRYGEALEKGRGKEAIRALEATKRLF